MKYSNPNSELGYIENYAEIENLKINNLRHTITSFAFGDFDGNGEYVISSSVIQELIQMEKFIESSSDNVEVCKSCLKLDKPITFIVSFETDRATLSLVEKLDYQTIKTQGSGAFSDMIEYVLDEVPTTGVVDRNLLYARWNIKVFGAQELDIFSCDEEVLEKYFGIVSRFKYLLKSNTYLLDKEEEIEENEAEYFNGMIEILRHYPKLNELVLEMLRKAVEEKGGELDPENPGFLRSINELLENAISANIGILSEEEKQEFDAERTTILTIQNVKREELFPTSTHENGAIVLNLAATKPKTVAELGVEYVSAFKTINEILKSNKDKETDGEEKKTFTNREMSLIHLDKAGIKKIQSGNKKAKQTLVDSIVKAAAKKADAKKAAAKKAEVKKAVAKKAAAKKAATKKADARKKAATKKKDDDKKKKEEEEKLKKKKEEEEKKKKAKKKREQELLIYLARQRLLARQVQRTTTPPIYAPTPPPSPTMTPQSNPTPPVSQSSTQNPPATDFRPPTIKTGKTSGWIATEDLTKEDYERLFVKSNGARIETDTDKNINTQNSQFGGVERKEGIEKTL